MWFLFGYQSKENIIPLFYLLGQLSVSQFIDRPHILDRTLSLIMGRKYYIHIHTSYGPKICTLAIGPKIKLAQTTYVANVNISF